MSRRVWLRGAGGARSAQGGQTKVGESADCEWRIVSTIGSATTQRI